MINGIFIQRQENGWAVVIEGRHWVFQSHGEVIEFLDNNMSAPSSDHIRLGALK